MIIVGTQWGDEGKGKIVDYFAKDASHVVRFQGGDNAGHTITTDGGVFKLSTLPSGILRGGVVNVITQGCVVNPDNLIQEITTLKEHGFPVTGKNLSISDKTCLILPLHRELDVIRDKHQNIGTTKKGIGPAYEDKVARRAIRVADLFDEDRYTEKVENLLVHHNILRRGYGKPELTLDEVTEKFNHYATILAPFVSDTSSLLFDAKSNGSNILYEGAQGALLDLDYGDYPYVTSSNTIAPYVGISAGIGKLTEEIVGVTKAYMSKVGHGPFPTYEKNISDYLSKVGKEVGTVTGRQRKCGWLDLHSLRQVVQRTGIDKLFITKIDVLNAVPEIKVCVGYGGNKPIYKIVKGWNTDLSQISQWADLPSNLLKYLDLIEDVASCKISHLSTSPNREDVIVK